MAAKAVARRGVSIALACRTFGVSETCYRYSPKLSDENEEIADLLVGLTDARKTWGFGLCFLHLRNVKGHPWNHKRVYRIYCALELNLRIKPRKRLKRDKPDALAVPEAPNMTWSMDFMADRLGDGRAVPAAERAGRLQPRRLGHRGGLLPAGRAGHPQPEPDHRMARQARAPSGSTTARNTSVASCWIWAEKQGIASSHIQPGQPQQNAYIERYNRTVRHEWLDQYIIESIEEAQDFATQWLWTYNNDRPNMGIGGITPAQKLKMAA